MTQRTRWLAALSLLLAVGVCAVRAEEEEEAAPPVRRAAEALPAPTPVSAAASCVRVVPPAPPAACPYFVQAPCPAPLVPVDAQVLNFLLNNCCPFTAFGPSYTPCPCPAGCPCPAPCPCTAPCPCVACPVCRAATATEAAEYMVQLTLCNATADGGRDVVTQPQVRVLENQTAAVEVSCGAESKEPSSVRMHMTVEKQGDGALLQLAVEDAHCIHNEDQAMVRTRTETMETRCHVRLDAPTKLLLGENADGSPRTWVEVTVKEMTSQGRTAGKSAAAQPADDGSPINDVAQTVNDVLGDVADAVYDLFGMETWSDEPTPPSGQYLQQPPQYLPPDPTFPIARELFAQEAVSCPAAGCARAACTPCPNSACMQCSATEAAKAEMHVSIDGSGDRKCVEISAGKSQFKASAERLMMHGHCIVLEGDVRAESCEDSGCGMVIKADKMCVEHKDGGLTIRVDGAETINADK